jgi:hypothetical protein
LLLSSSLSSSLSLLSSSHVLDSKNGEVSKEKFATEENDMAVESRSEPLEDRRPERKAMPTRTTRGRAASNAAELDANGTIN